MATQKTSGVSHLPDPEHYARFGVDIIRSSNCVKIRMVYISSPLKAPCILIANSWLATWSNIYPAAFAVCEYFN